MRLLGPVAAIAIAFGVAACTVPPEQRARDVCTAVCNCVEIGTSNQTDCVEMCIPQIGPISDDCLTCVYENSMTCSKLLNDCEASCDPQQPMP
jgi:hypothetical protein